MGHVTATSELFPSKNGEIHAVTSLDYYFGKISELEAEKFLLDPANARGTFLIRKAEHGNQNYILSIREGDGMNTDFVSHHRIQKNGRGEGFVMVSPPFETIDDLLERGSKCISTFGASFILQFPCSKPKYEKVDGDESEDSFNQWEVNRESVKLVRRIGEGSMGEVWKGSWNGKEVAVRKIKKENTDLDDFIEEARRMKKLTHHNILILHAVCTKVDPMYIILDYMSKGTLRRVLTLDNGRTLKLAQLLNFACQVATGMEYLESLGLVHRGLAARTILVGDGFICKIADFDVANVVKEGRYYNCHLAFVYRWAAPEVIKSQKYTCKSDVWSFGIVVMEMLTYGQTLYKGLRNRDLLAKIEEGHRMAKPSNCPDDIYNELNLCWNLEPQLRPTFGELRTFFDKYGVQLDNQDNNQTVKTETIKMASVRSKSSQRMPMSSSRRGRGRYPKEAPDARSNAKVDHRPSLNQFEPNNFSGKSYLSQSFGNGDGGYGGGIYRGRQFYGRPFY